jgi:hypothetical protein
VGVGITEIVNDEVIPSHPFNVGVTVIVACNTEFVEFVAVNAGISPVPFAANPIDGLEFVQVYVAPVGELVKTVAPMGV